MGALRADRSLPLVGLEHTFQHISKECQDKFKQLEAQENKTHIHYHGCKPGLTQCNLTATKKDESPITILKVTKCFPAVCNTTNIKHEIIKAWSHVNVYIDCKASEPSPLHNS